MRKQRLTFVMLLMAALVTTFIPTAKAETYGPWYSGGCSVTLVDTVLTVAPANGVSGAMYYYSGSTYTTECPWFNTAKEIATVIVIADGVTHIGDFAFYGHHYVKSISFGSGLQDIGMYAFSGTDLYDTLAIPEGVKSIGEYAFDDCEHLTTVIFPSTIREIGLTPFYDGTSLTDIYISANPNNLTFPNGDSFDDEGYGSSTRFHVPFAYLEAYRAKFSRTFVADDARLLTLTSNDNQHGTLGLVDRSTIYSNPLTSSDLVDMMTIIDANDDGSTWQFVDGGAAYIYNVANSADDWLVTMPITLRAGITYTVSIKARREDGNMERFEIKAATAGDAASLNSGTVVIANTWARVNAYTHTGTFTPDADGSYYIGVHCISNADEYMLNVQNLTVFDPSFKNYVDNGDGTYYVKPDEQVVVKATVADSCYVFTAWGDNTPINASLTDTITITADRTLTATFSAKSFTGDTIATSCDQFVWNGGTYTSTPTTAPTATYRNNDGCDSIVTLNLTINHSTTSDTSATECDQFVWRGETYTATPVTAPTAIYTNVAGCDSTVTLLLTINHSAETTFTAEAVGQYAWHGETFTESGSITRTIQTVAGCDSTVTISLTITPATEGIGTINAANVDFVIAPNPAVRGQMVRITFDGNIDMQGAQLSVFDIQGRQILNCESRNEYFEIQSSQLPSTGIYTMRLTLKDGTQTARRLIVK